MNDAAIGRVLVASLHQGIADILPTRLEFYENWLNPKGLRDGTIGLAPLGAVLSFLRREGEPYALITSRAGEYAADWTVANMSSMSRSLVRTLPVWLRARIVLRVARRMIVETYRSSRAIVRLRRRNGTIDLRGSIFCGVREPLDHPLCGFYAAAIGRLFNLFGLSTEVKVTQCRGTGAGACLLSISVLGERLVDAPAVAA
jgi:bacteriochlorophyll 4-vinyl reductase